MKIVTTFFRYPGYPHQYEDMLIALKKSCRRQMPDIEFVVLNLPEPENGTDRHIGYHSNTIKLRELASYADHENDDLIIIDADMLCMRPAYHAFEEIFDVAYTMRTRIIPGGPTINGGVMMIRNNERARSWLRCLCCVNENMFLEKWFHSLWASHYPGMNQSAMGYMIERSMHPAILHEYKTEEWNAVDCDWKNPEINPVFCHYKGQLREWIKNPLAKFVYRWYKERYGSNNRPNDGQE